MREFYESLSVRRRWIIAAAVGALVVVLVLFVVLTGGEPEAGPTTTTGTVSTTATTAGAGTSTTSTTSTTTVPGAAVVWPLTGIGSDEEQITQPVLAVKIDNSSTSRPHAGLEEADLVFDVPVEGGISRLLAFYQSRVPDEIGPVRSIREVDLKLLPPFRPLFAYSGGIPKLVGSVASVAIDVGDPLLGPAAYRRDPDRPAPYDLMLDPIAALEARLDAPPGTGPWLRFTDSPIDGQPAGTVEIDASVRHQPMYGYSAADGGYLRFHGRQPHTTESGDQLVAANVIVLFVDQLDAGRTDSSGAAVPDFEVVGRGDAVVFTGGLAVEGRWERGRVTDFFRFFDDSNRELGLAPGVTWIHLVPRGRSVTWR